MLDAIYAEVLKLRRHRATWLMVWIFPIVVTLGLIAAQVYRALVEPGAPSPDKGAAAWIADTTILLRFPPSGAGRCLTAGFAALVFAGEYGWNTWKLVIPARVRWHLIVAKWIVTLGFVIAALIATDVIGLLATWIGTVQGDPVPEGVTLGNIVAAHLRGISVALVPIVYTIAFAALFAILTQSLLAAVILSIALVILEGLLPFAALFGYARAPRLTVVLIEGLPFYHLLNSGAWARGAGLTLPLGPGGVSMSWATSLAMLGGWIVAACAATLARFVRQDLN